MGSRPATRCQTSLLGVYRALLWLPWVWRTRRVSNCGARGGQRVQHHRCSHQTRAARCARRQDKGAKGASRSACTLSGAESSPGFRMRFELLCTPASIILRGAEPDFIASGGCVRVWGQWPDPISPFLRVQESNAGTLLAFVW